MFSDQDDVSHNNPQLAQFLAAHPEVARNPEFYLFFRLNHEDGEPDVALERAVWPDVYRSQSPPNPLEGFLHDLSPLLHLGAQVFALAVALILGVGTLGWETQRGMKLTAWLRGLDLSALFPASLEGNLWLIIPLAATLALVSGVILCLTTEKQ